MGYGARLSITAKRAQRTAKIAALARHIRTPEQFEAVIRQAKPEHQPQIRAFLAPRVTLTAPNAD